jgi:NitT/TauT family transport system substrate-binding protein
MEKNAAVFPILDLNFEWQKIFGDSIPFTQTALLVKRELAEKSPGIVDEYLIHLQSSINWVNQNPIQASRLIVKYEILPDTLLAQRSIPRSNLQYAQAFKEMKGIQEYLKVFYTFNPLIIGGKLPDDEFYYKTAAD